MRASFRVIALIAGLAIVPLAAAGVIADAEVSQPGVWLAWGGATRLHFNPDALVRFGIRIAGTPGASARIEGVPGRNYEVETYPTEDAGALQINHTGRTIDGVDECREDGREDPRWCRLPRPDRYRLATCGESGVT